MTKTIKSQTSDTHYFLTIDEQGKAQDCTCKDRAYRPGRPGGCKHMSQFNAEVAKAERFLALKAAIEAMEQTRRCYYEMSIGY